MEDGEIVEIAAREEEEATDGSNRQPKPKKSPYDSLHGATASVQDIVSQILSLKSLDSNNNRVDKESKSKRLRELASQMLLNFVSLRQVNRAILVEEDRVKVETEKAKAPVDFTTLQLHNLMYEKSHYLKAIKACKDFKSKYPEIELASEEEFFSQAPESIKAPVLSGDADQDLMLKRLNFELHQRKELCKLQEKLEEKKRALLETIANRKKFLSSLPSHLKALKKASLPMQNQLGVLHSKKLKQQNSAELLPPPLYVVFSQLMAQKEAFEECIDLEVVGSMKEAQAFARQQAIKDSGISADVDNSMLDDDFPDDEDDGQRRRKRPKKIASKENLDQAGVYQVHPLKVLLYVYDDEASDPASAKLVSLKFEFLLKLNVVCVGIEGSHEGPENNILCNLFPDDTGIELPHQSAKLLVGDAFAFDEKKTSRPYKWAQHLAAIDFLPEIPPLLSGHETPCSETKNDFASGLTVYRQQNRVQTILQRIRCRKKAQQALAEQLDSLAKLNWPSLNNISLPWALHSPLCNLNGWLLAGTSSSQASSLAVTNTDPVQESMVIDSEMGAPSEGAREDGELPFLVSAAPVVNGVTNSLEVANVQHSKQLALISKSIASPVSKTKSLSLKRRDEDTDLLFDAESELDEVSQVDSEAENGASIMYNEMAADNSWIDYGGKEYTLVLTRESDANAETVKLEAKIKISMEYPLRPPLFSVALFVVDEYDNNDRSESSKWYNELRAMEAEVNLNILKMLPSDQNNRILAHQVHCLAMLFDSFMNDSSSSEKSSCIIDVGLSKPVSGKLLMRSFRGRDRRKMISWSDRECTSDYPH